MKKAFITWVFYNIESADVKFCFYEGKDLFHDNIELFNDSEITGTYKKTVEGGGYYYSI